MARLIVTKGGVWHLDLEFDKCALLHAKSHTAMDLINVGCGSLIKKILG